MVDVPGRPCSCCWKLPFSRTAQCYFGGWITPNEAGRAVDAAEQRHSLKFANSEGERYFLTAYNTIDRPVSRPIPC